MNIGDLVKSTLPWLTAALNGPVGVATLAAGKIAEHLGIGEKTVDAVKVAIAGATPEQLLGMKKLENDFSLEMTKAGYANAEALAVIDLHQIEAVNQTIRSEIENSEKEAWYQKMWRPACGFSVAIGSFAGVLSTCYLAYKGIILKDAGAVNAIPALAAAIAAILAVPGAAVGIAAWHRGMLQREQAQTEKE